MKSLNESRVEYLLLGGYAVVNYGYVRATGDLDIWIACHPSNAERVAEALRRFGFDMPEVTGGIFTQTNSMVRMGVPPYRIEIMTSVSGVEFEECYAERNDVVVDGIHIPIISLPHLKRNKEASGRLKDLLDLEHLP